MDKKAYKWIKEDVSVNKKKGKNDNKKLFIPHII